MSVDYQSAFKAYVRSGGRGLSPEQSLALEQGATGLGGFLLSADAIMWLFEARHIRGKFWTPADCREHHLYRVRSHLRSLRKRH